MMGFPPAGVARSGAGDVDEAVVIVSTIGRARGFALSVGALAVLCATAETGEERAALAAELAEYRDRYRDAVADTSRIGASFVDLSRIEAERKVVHGFARRLAELPDDAADLTRAEAARIAEVARNEVLPAIYQIIAVVQERQEEMLAARMDRMAERAALVDGMLTEMGRIGRMIGLISINASVEAARAGGESGRAFQVIAEEVRSLARQSAELLARMRSRMNGDEEETRPGLRRE